MQKQKQVFASEKQKQKQVFASEKQGFNKSEAGICKKQKQGFAILEAGICKKQKQGFRISDSFQKAESSSLQSTPVSSLESPEKFSQPASQPQRGSAAAAEAALRTAAALLPNMGDSRSV